MTNHIPTEIECGGERRTLVSRFRFNVLSYGYSQAVTILVQLLLVPFFLKFWGPAKYAEWLVITGIPQILTLMDFGVTQASAARATIFAGAKERILAIKSMQSAQLFSASVVLLIAVVALCVVPMLNMTSLFDLHAIGESDAASVLKWMLGYLCLSLLSESFGACFRVVDRTALGVFVLANRRVIDIAICIVMLSIGASPLSLAAAMFFGQVVMTSALVVILQRASSWRILGFSGASLSELKEVWRPAVASLSIPLAQVITLQGGIQVLNHLSTGTIVVAFAMTRTLMRLVIQFGIAISNSLTPEISRMAGRGDLDEATRFAMKIGAAVFSVCLVVYLAMIAIGPLIISFWSHGSVSVGRSTLALVGIHAILNAAWYVPAAVLFSTNKHGFVGATYAISSTLALLAWIASAHLVSPVVGASLLLAAPEVAVLCLLACHLWLRRSRESL